MKVTSYLKSLVIVAACCTAFIQAAEMPPLAVKSGCKACHEIDKKKVGPAWMAVAKRYDASARAQLIEKVKKGGKGNWLAVTGGVPMPAYSPRVSDDHIAELVDFILGLDS